MHTNVCVLRSGGDFAPEHVVSLSKMVPDLVCLSDVDIKGVNCIPLDTDWPKWWAKMEAFNTKKIEGDILLIDLDTIVINYPEIPDCTTVLQDFYMPTLMGSGFMYLVESDRNMCYNIFARNPDRHMADCRTRRKMGDQGFLNPLIGNSNKWGRNIVSWKKHCQDGIPDYADVICFHGKPRPWDVS